MENKINASKQMQREHHNAVVRQHRLDSSQVEEWVIEDWKNGTLPGMHEETCEAFRSLFIPELQSEVRDGNKIYDKFCMDVCSPSERANCKTICIGLQKIMEVRKLDILYQLEMERRYEDIDFSDHYVDLDKLARGED